jgi:hypothetical protein
MNASNYRLVFTNSEHHADLTWLVNEEFDSWVVEEIKRAGLWGDYEAVRDLNLCLMGL